MTTRSVWAIVAVASLLGCATVSPQDQFRAQTHRRLAQSQLQRGALELAIREYRASLALAPKDPETHFGLAEAYRRKGMLAEAEAELTETIRLAPDHQDARLNLSVVYMQQERWEDAIRETTALFDDPTFLRPSRALVNRGWAHYKSGDLEGARRDLAEALVSDPGNFQARLNLGRVLLDRGEVKAAMGQFEKVLELVERRPLAVSGPAEAQARFHLAQAHVTLGQSGRAIEQLRVASERGGRSEWGQKSREYLSTLE